MATIYDTLQKYPSECLYYDKEFEIDDIEYELEHDFFSIVEITSDKEKSKLIPIGIEIGLSPCLESVKIFTIMNDSGKRCKFAVWEK